MRLRLRPILIAGALVGVPLAALTWPSDADWIPVQKAGADITDVCGDHGVGGGWLDGIGDSANPAAFY